MDFNMKRTACKICDQEIAELSLGYHVKRYHNLTVRQYKIQTNEIESKLCLNCDKDITHLRDAANFVIKNVKQNIISNKHI